METGRSGNGDGRTRRRGVESEREGKEGGRCGVLAVELG